jgi:hypothetical protein
MTANIRRYSSAAAGSVFAALQQLFGNHYDPKQIE